MKTASPELIALLNGSQQFTMADLLTFTLKDGSLLRYTGADINVVSDGNTHTPLAFKRSRTRITIGVRVDTLDLSLYVGVGDLIGGIPMPQFAQNGGFDGAELELRRAFLSGWGQPAVGSLWMFSGRVGPIDPSRTEIRMSVKSDLELLNAPIPRNLYEPRCGHIVFNDGCGLSRAAYKASSTVLAGSSRTEILCGLAQADGYFDRGTVTFSTGPNAGVTRTIKAYVPGKITVSVPLPYEPATGNAIDAYPGCDGLPSTCENKFANKPKLRAFPYVPVPETAF